MLVKQTLDIAFAKGLDTKTDPKRVEIGSFLALENTVFDKGGLLQKRNGFGNLQALPASSYSYLTTFNGNLTAFGQNVAAYNSGGASWVTKGMIQPLSLRTLPLLRNNLNQVSADSAVAANGLVCTVYLESDGSTVTNKYVIADSVTGQNITAPAAIPVTSGTVSGGMRVFTLGNNFILVFTNTITATAHLQYVAISTAEPTLIGANTDIAASYVPATGLSWDGQVSGDRLFLAYNTTAGGQALKVTYLSQALNLAAANTFAGSIATNVSVTVDGTDPMYGTVVYVSYYDRSGATGYTLAVNAIVNTLMAPQQIISSGAFANLTSAAQGGVCKVFAEAVNAYSFDGSIPTNFIDAVAVTADTSTVGTPYVMIRSVGLASKAFIVDGTIYVLTAFQSPYQPTYFLVNGSASRAAAPVISAKLAYGNGGGYLTKGLPSVTVTDFTALVAYLFKDLIQAVNKDTNVPSGTQVNGIYSQTGINLGSFTFGTEAIDTAEVGSDLHISGGFLWSYDGYLPVEHNFFLWPDTDLSTPTGSALWSATGGSMVAKPDGSTSTNAYYYQITYEWTDNQGNAFRSAPSIPVAVTTTGSGTSGSVTLHIPTLRLTFKTANPVKIVIYRWSAGQQAYYQVTSVASPTLNSTTIDSITFIDTLADATILGNNLLYTTGGVIEDVNAPGSDLLTLFDTRLWLVDAEDRNLLWFSKQVIEATPVEMSDLFTIFIPPTVATATGEITSIFPMDDKLIISKGGNSFVYINGAGPDNTGANNQYSEPIFITSTVGCSNQKSIVLIPQGLMFQSNKGIWLLDRGLNTSYIGAPVEDFTQGETVLSALTVPGTNQVRLTLTSGVTLMYDYFYGQWGSFVSVPSVSATIYQGLHTYINQAGLVRQETLGRYLDGSTPVLMRFQTGPLRLDALQSYQRAYFFYLLGEFLSPHKIMVSVAYDYSDTPEHSVLLTPGNFSTPFGSGSSQSPYGQGTPFGGPKGREQFRVFLNRQRCQAFAIFFQEIYDGSFGAPAGAGLTLSGINVVLGFKSKFKPISAAKSYG